MPAVGLLAVGLLAVGCRAEEEVGAEPSAPPWDTGRAPAPVRPGMVWVPPGVLIAGTPPTQLPRIADEELPGVEVPMSGFFIDKYNHPAEPGAIPVTGLTQAEARAICEEQGKRLCTELEWERACKGTQNFTYEYGDSYDAAVCATGTSDALAPNGANARCRSSWGVADLHGSAWNWTSSAWGRGTDDSRVVVRGGNGREGDLVGRCANARPLAPVQRDQRVGVRCCAGEVNEATVALSVERGSELGFRSFDPRIAKRLEELAPEDIKNAVKGRPAADHFRVERLWMWRPIGNEELIIGGGCAHPAGHDVCGILIARLFKDKLELLAFVTSDWWIPTVGAHERPRTLYIYGGDISGAFRKPVIYQWGRIAEGDKFRKRGGGWLAPPQ
jgi:hypothetical protein